MGEEVVVVIRRLHSSAQRKAMMSINAI